VSDAAETEAGAKADPLKSELARCRTAAADAADTGCRTAWEVSRRRFMGETQRYPIPSATPADGAIPPGAAAPVPHDRQER
jgi:hypothetical protein